MARPEVPEAQKAKAVTITLPPDLLEYVDSFPMNRSATIQMIVAQYQQEQQIVYRLMNINIIPGKIYHERDFFTLQNGLTQEVIRKRLLLAGFEDLGNQEYRAPSAKKAHRAYLNYIEHNG